MLSSLKQLIKLDAGYSNVNDASLQSLGPMPNLHWLNLDSTDVGNGVVAALRNMRSLQTLNVADTRCASHACKDSARFAIDDRRS